MRVVIEEISGKDLVLLMELLRKFEFGSKKELLESYDRWLQEADDKPIGKQETLNKLSVLYRQTADERHEVQDQGAMLFLDGQLEAITECQRIIDKSGDKG